MIVILASWRDAFLKIYGWQEEKGIPDFTEPFPTVLNRNPGQNPVDPGSYGWTLDCRERHPEIQKL